MDDIYDPYASPRITPAIGVDIPEFKFRNQSISFKSAYQDSSSVQHESGSTPQQDIDYSKISSHQCALSGDIEGIAFYLANSLHDLDTESDEGLTPLHLAVINDHFNATNILLAHEVQVDQICAKNGLRLLRYCILKQTTEICDLLLNVHADSIRATFAGYSLSH
ncbi:hypothetical protein CSAL01_12921 [Colletotrichum salicis]|uniref:Uncharacterized protein n=1 Tax=Colletotrichum salicis TaxID=1209931 RepID=A0A135V1L8_9PEZI|nr:hypothetical protein CSAL01_12921 [Colletotrichum salicis]